MNLRPMTLQRRLKYLGTSAEYTFCLRSECICNEFVTSSEVHCLQSARYLRDPVLYAVVRCILQAKFNHGRPPGITEMRFQMHMCISLSRMGTA